MTAFEAVCMQIERKAPAHSCAWFAGALEKPRTISARLDAVNL